MFQSLIASLVSIISYYNSTIKTYCCLFYQPQTKLIPLFYKHLYVTVYCLKDLQCDINNVFHRRVSKRERNFLLN